MKADGGLTTKALDYLATQRDVWAERRNSGSKLIPKKGGGFYRIELGEPGTPDICLLLRGIDYQTIYAGIETKTPKGKLSAAQKRFHAKAAQWNMPIMVARSLQDVQDFVAWLRGKVEL